MAPKTWFDKEGVKDAFKEKPSKPIEKAALLVEREAKASMGTGGGAAGTPSEPGDPPNVQSGNLRASIRIASTAIGTYLVGPTFMAWYGRLHEQPENPVAAGTVEEFGGRNFAQRAFMRPALAKVMRDFPKLFKGMRLGDTQAGRKNRDRKS